jgi:hypothetical protein
MLCKLCGSNLSIERSHIIPQFIGKWIKETSPLRGLRNADQPNLRRQDTTSMPLLCPSCEQVLSSQENKFAQEIFYPFNDKGQHSFTYSSWLLRFAVSLSWRVAVSLLDKLRNKDMAAATYIETALSDWEDFLVAQAPKPGPYLHHLFFDSIYPCRERVGFGYDRRYALGTIDYGIPYGSERVAIYVKIPGMVFFCSVKPPNPVGWRNTQIFNSGRLTTSDQMVTDPWFWEHMRDSVLNVPKSMEAMSDRQKRKLAKRMENAPTRAEIRRKRAENGNVPR